MNEKDKKFIREQLNKMVMRNYQQPMTTEERLKGGASALPVIGDAISAYDAYQSARQGDYLGAGLNAIGALPFIPALGGITKYVRRTNADSVFNGAPYAMFVELGKNREGLDRIGKYGEKLFITSDKGAVNVSDLQKNILKEIRKQKIHQEYGTTAANLAREANPLDIVNSAGLFDNPNIITAIYEQVFAKKGIDAVKTKNGLIKFTQENIRKVK